MKQLFLRVWNSPTFTSWGNLFSSSIKLLIVTPLILTKYDVDTIAFWYLLLTIGSLSVVFDFGILPTLSRFTSYAYGGISNISMLGKVELTQNERIPNWLLIGKIYSSTRTIYFILVFFILITLALIAYFIVFDFVEKVSNAYKWYLNCYIVFSLGILVNFFSKSFESTLIGINKVALNNRWNILLNCCSSAVMFIVLISDGGIILLASTTLFISLTNLVRSYLLVRHVENGVFKSFPLFFVDYSLVKQAWAPVWRSALGILGSTGVIQISALFYSRISDSMELASYLFTLKLVTTIAQFSQAPFYSKTPEYSGLRAQGDNGQLIIKTQKSINLSLLVFVLMAFSLIALGDWILLVLGSNTELLDFRIIILMVTVYYFERHHAMHAQIFSTTNRIPFYIPIIFSGIVNLALIWILLPKIGIWAFPVSHGVSNLMINNWWNVKISLNSLGANPFLYLSKSFITPTFLFLLLLVFAYLIKA